MRVRTRRLFIDVHALATVLAVGLLRLVAELGLLIATIATAVAVIALAELRLLITILRRARATLCLLRTACAAAATTGA